MTQKQLEFFAEYFMNQISNLEAEIVQYQTQVRFRKVTINDCYELISAIQRQEMLIQVYKDLNRIFFTKTRNEKQE